jgi:N-acetylneuraminic acid mutarotase
VKFLAADPPPRGEVINVPVVFIRRHALCLVVVSVLAFVVPSAQAQMREGPGQWVKKAAMPIPRTEISVAELDGKMYVAGGYVPGSVTSYLLQEYDPATDKWRDRARMPLGLNHVGLVGHEGKLYVFGGFIRQNQDPVANAFVYDPKANSWKELAPLTSKRGAVALASLGGKIHLLGGAVGVGFRMRKSVNLHEVYDPATNKYASRAPLPERRDHMGLVALGGKLHAFGGRYESFANNSNLHDVYDPATDKWTPLAPLPTARSGFAYGLLDGLIVVIGGEGMKGVFNENEAYDPKTNKWRTLISMPYPRHGTGAAVIGGVMYIPGGGPVRGGSRLTEEHEAFSLK